LRHILSILNGPQDPHRDTEHALGVSLDDLVPIADFMVCHAIGLMLKRIRRVHKGSRTSRGAMTSKCVISLVFFEFEIPLGFSLFRVIVHGTAEHRV
jgi:hypothetical protein